MPKQISSLSVTLGATVAPFVKSFQTAGAAVTGLTSKLGTIGSTIAKFTGIGAAISGLVGGVGLGALVTQAMSAIDVNAKLSDRLGITTESLAAMQLAGDLAGVGTEALTGGLEKMLKNLGEATALGGAAAESFSRLGLNAATLANLPTDQALGAIADKLKAIQNPAERARAAVDVFGKSGQSLLPLLMGGAEGIAAAAKEADALGLSFNRVDAGKVEQANDAITRIKSAFMGVGRTLAVAFAPGIKSAADVITSGMIRVVAIIKQYAPIAIDFFKSAWAKLTPIVAGAWTIISGLVSRVAGVFSSIYSAVEPVVSNIVNFIAARWGAISGFLSGVWDGILSAATSVWNAIYNFVAPIVSAIVDYISTHWESIVATAVGYFQAVYGVVSTVFNGVWKVITTVAGAVYSAWKWAMDKLGLSSKDAGNTTKGAVAKIGEWWTWLVTKVTGYVNEITYALNNFGAVMDIVTTTVAYDLVRAGNEFIYFFSDVIPGLLKWFQKNWRDVFQTAFNLFKSFTMNIAKNATNLGALLASMLRGDGGKFEWTGILDGFENTIKDVPKIAKRIPGAVENALKVDLDKQLADYGTGLGNELVAKAKAAADSTKGITDAIKNFFGGGKKDGKPDEKPVIPTPEPPEMPKPPTFSIDTTGAMEDIANVGKAAKDAAGKVELLTAGSARAMQFQAQADFERLLPKAGNAQANRPAVVAAVPLKPTAANAVRDSSANSQLEKIIQLLSPGLSGVLDKLPGVELVGAP